MPVVRQRLTCGDLGHDRMLRVWQEKQFNGNKEKVEFM